MADLASESSALRSLFNTHWTLTDVAWDGFGGPVFDSSAVKEFIRPALGGTDIRRVTCGTENYRGRGTLIIQVFTKAEVGDKRALTLSEAMIELLRRRLAEGLEFTDLNVERVGVREGFNQVNLYADFRWDYERSEIE